MNPSLVGGGRSKRSQQWPEELCQQMAGGLYDEIVYGPTKIPFAAEHEAEEHEEAGPVDGVYDEDDLGLVVERRRLHDEDENVRTEDLEENVPIEVEDMVMD